ncbi:MULTISPECIES: D-aminoacyl-tRNA deacylase [unclassified Paenibacillus]|uniref:D-aminoacyl-tRNA deacylase n=1 Tax=unclassified Paenibacillus TaxID=185978 RepID=UPI00240535FD|nr:MULTISPECIES: D-aminoacyl-tRNA deacylase [unclassified Paenibacillus]MDF9843937.1 D-tyrosyl-tRNA(Tyr) deacylase [Paenibacillus sp. PastF-2]MDF9850542.1 D-tyrosyl-tRNA(Tyr) deacylase [Paenibacillus sp. PastM-2]MDF9856268.1 D-tyrosyl-tRNA(Tyr) deacylase [Paenibacillus sp. PastF-1]MDH6481503.1 D-tyrosyl-tRNA(Tyr) deacylase [Paenibacillus sp. PastH-2]MDH6509817.1 D-tyrosyl-tRNA(Tyr) deacylase [Paenibacillus sp. PastM-3]
MRAVVQRCKEAKVTVEGSVTGAIKEGLMLLIGVTHGDTEKDAKYLADKIAGLRIFEDEAGKMNYSVTDTGGAILSVSQFTLYGDCRKGRRPNFMAAAAPAEAQQLYDYFNQELRAGGLQVETGVFGAMMDVSFTNWGPVTLILDSRD